MKVWTIAPKNLGRGPSLEAPPGCEGFTLHPGVSISLYFCMVYVVLLYPAQMVLRAHLLQLVVLIGLGLELIHAYLLNSVKLI